MADLLPDSHYQKKILMDYKRDYMSKFDSEPSTFGGHAYDAMYIIIESLKAEGPDRVKIRDHIENLRGFIGIADVYKFSMQDHCGLTKDAFEMLIVKDGKFCLAQ